MHDGLRDLWPYTANDTIGLPHKSALGPRRRWKPRLCRNHFIRPNGHLVAILPLNGDRLMGYLEPAIIDREVAQNSLGRMSQERLTELVGVQTSGLLQSFDQEPAAGVGGG